MILVGSLSRRMPYMWPILRQLAALEQQHEDFQRGTPVDVGEEMDLE